MWEATSDALANATATYIYMQELMYVSLGVWNYSMHACIYMHICIQPPRSLFNVYSYSQYLIVN